MSDNPENAVPEQSEEAALAEMMAGYKQARANAAPADTTPPVSTPATSSADAPAPADPAPPPEAEAAPSPAPAPEQTLAETVAELKAKVKAMPEGDPDAIRRLHGEIGNMNRMLKQLRNARTGPCAGTGSCARTRR